MRPQCQGSAAKLVAPGLASGEESSRTATCQYACSNSRNGCIACRAKVVGGLILAVGQFRGARLQALPRGADSLRRGHGRGRVPGKLTNHVFHVAKLPLGQGAFEFGLPLPARFGAAFHGVDDQRVLGEEDQAADGEIVQDDAFAAHRPLLSQRHQAAEADFIGDGRFRRPRRGQDQFSGGRLTGDALGPRGVQRGIASRARSSARRRRRPRASCFPPRRGSSRPPPKARSIAIRG